MLHAPTSYTEIMIANTRGWRSAGHSKANNQKRQAYVTREPRYFLTFLLATIAAVVVHLGLYYASPILLDFDIITREPAEQEELVYRVLTLPEEIKQEVDITPPAELKELDILPTEEVEIDILDAELEELVMAPGETRLALPEVEPVADETIELGMEEGSHEKMVEMVQTVASEKMSLPEPTPLNENVVVVQAQAAMNTLDTSDLLSGELLAQVENQSILPQDTRSLSDLLRVSSLGADSGVARLGADVLFAFGDNTLRNSARVSLIQLAALIRKNPNTRFIIEGHTDSFGSTSLNAQLSLRRAAAVRDWLEKNHLPLYHVYIRACGNTRPIAERDGSREQQALNRRVEIHMRRLDEKLPPDSLDYNAVVDLRED